MANIDDIKYPIIPIKDNPFITGPVPSLINKDDAINNADTINPPVILLTILSKALIVLSKSTT